MHDTKLILALTFFIAVIWTASAHAQTITSVAGTSSPTNNGDSGPALKTNVGDPFGVEIGPDGALYVCEVRNHRVRRVDLKTGDISTVAGNGRKGYSGDGGPAINAALNEPYEVRFNADGDMLFVEMQNHVVRIVDAKTGVISTIAGSGEVGYSGDGGPAIKASFNRPHSIAIDAVGNVYIADIGNHRIRRVDRNTGLVESIAGNGQKQLPIEGASAKGSAVLGPRALFIQKNMLWVALREGHSVWRLNLKEPAWRRIAGNGKKGYSGDGEDPLQCTFNGPKGIAVGPRGRVFVVDTENHAIRMIDLQKDTVETFAGHGPRAKGGAGDGGKATAAQLDRPHGVCVDRDGTVYIGDSLNHRVRVVSPDNTR